MYLAITKVHCIPAMEFDFYKEFDKEGKGNIFVVQQRNLV